MLVNSAFNDLFQAVFPDLRRNVAYVSRDWWQARRCDPGAQCADVCHDTPSTDPGTPGYLHRSATNLLYDRRRGEPRQQRLAVELDILADHVWGGGAGVTEIRHVTAQAMRGLSRPEELAIILVDLRVSPSTARNSGLAYIGRRWIGTVGGL